ncbi:hypothetical protein OG21DRAFT_1426771 [Imleria badia]|nr:hypothetical protein OG21DRAFT_1426771 [Imleria badia]
MSLPAPSIKDIWEQTLAKFNKRPCLWQVQVAKALLEGDRDVVCTAGTLMGKTLAFWIPLLFHPNAIQIIMTPLNQLGQQQVESLESDIEDLKFQAVIISPEQMMKPGGGFKALLKKKQFIDHIIAIILDEAHCIIMWGKFRPEYKELSQLRFTLSRRLPYLVTLATLTSETLHGIMKVLDPHRKEDLLDIQTHTDRPNIKLCV